ncbi:hypothetical protein UFOVP1365_34 [uncultured Caudovirales phage]|uniref:Uncharacterized protein n=1 Tax=uncultured Caudovirales phage TaxID=2100421 RepID=A0A6J5S3A8_9CAUD|nr:hypothetical protein UFOVP1365_34 [uncultured Caudovirales phage]
MKEDQEQVIKDLQIEILSLNDTMCYQADKIKELGAQNHALKAIIGNPGQYNLRLKEFSNNLTLQEYDELINHLKQVRVEGDLEEQNRVLKSVISNSVDRLNKQATTVEFLIDEEGKQ